MSAGVCLKCVFLTDQLERVFLRLGHAETDDQLQDIISKFLPPVLLKLSSVQEGVRKKVSGLLYISALRDIVYRIYRYIFIYVEHKDYIASGGHGHSISLSSTMVMSLHGYQLGWICLQQ